MSPTSEQLAAALVVAANQELGKALDRVQHCLGQLTDEQIWRRDSESMNSIGNLILHLCGNVQQWLVSGIGGDRDRRQRPSEFAERGPIPKSELLHQLEAAVSASRDALARTNAEELLRRRLVQGFDVNGLEAIFDSIPHFRGHTQEIIHMTRSMLGDAYQFAWKPSTPQEGM